MIAETAFNDFLDVNAAVEKSEAKGQARRSEAGAEGANKKRLAASGIGPFAGPPLDGGTASEPSPQRAATIKTGHRSDSHNDSSSSEHGSHSKNCSGSDSGSSSSRSKRSSSSKSHSSERSNSSNSSGSSNSESRSGSNSSGDESMHTVRNAGISAWSNDMKATEARQTKRLGRNSRREDCSDSADTFRRAVIARKECTVELTAKLSANEINDLYDKTY